MKVLIYSDMGGSAWGGSEVLWSKLVPMLKERGVQVGVTCFMSDQARRVCQDSCLSETLLLPISAIRIPDMFWTKLLNKLSLGHLQRYWRQFWRNRQRRFCERFSPDIVFVSMAWPDAGKPIHPYLQRSSARYICFLHSVAEHYIESCATKERRAFFEGAFKILATGKRSIGILEKWLGKALENAKPMLNFVDLYSFTPKHRRQASDKPGVTKLLCVARLAIHEKGQDILLQSLSEILDLNWQLTVAGEGPDRHFLEERARHLGISNRVNFLGEVPSSNVPKLLWDHDLFVLSSRYEGLPLSLLEAMASGLPCIASDVGSIREVLLHEETGLLVQPNNPIQLSEALRRMIKDVKLREKCSTAGRILVMQKCDENKFLKYIADLLEKAVHNNNFVPLSTCQKMLGNLWGPTGANL